MSDSEIDVDQRLEELDARVRTLTEQCLYRSASRVASEIRRLARAEYRLSPYLHATFTVMNSALDLLDPSAGRDSAVEIIGLLESDERARVLQPDLPEAEYEDAVQWLSACGYDNLARATAEMNGYNSDGVQACISDGIQVCRRTGKQQCITCFREYAAECHRAADDLDMAMHYARAGIAHENPGPHDRRWAGARELTNALLRQGQLDAASDQAERLCELSRTWHTPFRAKLVSKQSANEIACLRGVDIVRTEEPGEEKLLDGEFPWYEMRRDQVKAVEASCKLDHPRAIEILNAWDRRLLDSRCLDIWFDSRLRLLATHRLAGNDRLFERLSNQLETKAQLARDWLTLRCLQRLRDVSVPAAPIPLVADLNSGPFGTRQSLGSLGEGVSKTENDIVQKDENETLPIETHDDKARAAAGPPSIVARLWDRIKALKQKAPNPDKDAQDEDSLEQILGDLLAIDPLYDHSSNDVMWLLHTMCVVICDGGRGRDAWEWAKTLRDAYQQDATILSWYALLGSRLRFGPNEELADLVSESQLENMFRESLDLDSEIANNFRRAGDFYRLLENLGEAERCYARGFRLKRADPALASQLAAIYRRTERPRDALAVLDMALRAGSKSPDLMWDAALSARHLGQHESALTYFTAFDQIVPKQPWANYYRASSLIALDRPSEVLEAAELESIYNPECPFHVIVHRAVALANLDRHDEFRDCLREVLAIPLFQVDYLNLNGLCELFEMLWAPVAELDPSDELRRQFEDRAISANVAPNALFATGREENDHVDEVNFYECVFNQPVDERWADWPARHAAEDGMSEYTVTWGVLALSEEDAAEASQVWQARAFPIAAHVTGVKLVESGYREQVGVVWQGYRESAD